MLVTTAVLKENMREKNMRSDVIDFDLSAPRNWYFEQMVFIEKKSNVLNGDYHSGVRFEGDKPVLYFSRICD
jgi:hypothetical protein